MKNKTYRIDYRHNDKTYYADIVAYDDDDAEERLTSLRKNGIVSFELVEEGDMLNWIVGKLCSVNDAAINAHRYFVTLRMKTLLNFYYAKIVLRKVVKIIHTMLVNLSYDWLEGCYATASMFLCWLNVMFDYVNVDEFWEMINLEHSVDFDVVRSSVLLTKIAERNRNANSN